MFIPDPRSEFLPFPVPGSRIKKIPDNGTGSASKNFSILTQKSKLSEI
jgi:hypothetical protein